MGDPGKVKRMFKLNASFTTSFSAFFFWKSDDPVVATIGGNAPGAKGVTKFELQTLNLKVDAMDTEPRPRGNQ